MRRLAILAMVWVAIMVTHAQVSPMSPTRVVLLAKPRNPTVTINQASGQLDPTSVTPIRFTAVFSETVTGFTGSDVMFTGSVGGPLTATVTGTGAIYTVSVSGMGTTGTVIASIPAGAAVNSHGDTNAASTSTDNTITWNQPVPPPPTVTWTKQLKNGVWPASSGYTSILYDDFLKKVLFYFPVTTDTIYGSDVFAYDAGTNTFERHPHGNQTPDSTRACLAAGGDIGIERSIAVDGYDWPQDRHPEQMAIDTLRHWLWVRAGVCRNYFDGVDPNHTDRIWAFHLDQTFANSLWTKTTTTVINDCEQEGEMVYVPGLDALVCYGGLSGFGRLFIFCPSDTLSPAQMTAGCVTPKDWAEVVTATRPLAVRLIGLWYESATQKIVLFGGMNGAGNAFYNDTWAYDVPTHTWTNKTPANPPPAYAGSGVAQPSMALDTTRHKFLYHQLTNTGAPKDWQYDPVANVWTALTSTVGPVPDLPVDLFLMAYDAFHDAFVALVYNPASDPQNHPSIWHGRW